MGQDSEAGQAAVSQATPPFFSGRLRFFFKSRLVESWGLRPLELPGFSDLEKDKSLDEPFPHVPLQGFIGQLFTHCEWFNYKDK